MAKPDHVEIAIIGTGTAGLAAYRAAREYTDSLALIEGGPYGTTCARVGCMPSKLLIAAAEAVHGVTKAPQFGIEIDKPPRVNGKAVMQRVREERDRFVGFVIESIEGFDERHRRRGYARFIDNHTLEIDGKRLTADRIVIATGSRPAVPPPFLELNLGDRLIVNDDVFDWHDLPESVAVFGPGVIGLELGQALARLGVRVRIFGRGGRVGPVSDPAVLTALRQALAGEVYLDPDANIKNIARDDSGGVAIEFTDLDGTVRHETFAYLLAATGRTPNVDKLGLENTDLPLDDRGIPVFDPHTMQIGGSPVFIAGDVNNDRPLLHEAADEGKIAGDNAGRYPDIRAGQRRVPLGIVFSEPQIAIVGQRFDQLVDNGCAIGEVSFVDQGRSRVMLQNQGLLRVYGDYDSGRFLGAEMAGPRAEHIGHLLAWACQQQLTVAQMLELPFYHPVIEEGVRTALRKLDRALKRGPEPVPRCLDCGPGS